MTDIDQYKYKIPSMLFTFYAILFICIMSSFFWCHNFKNLPFIYISPTTKLPNTSYHLYLLPSHLGEWRMEAKNN